MVNPECNGLQSVTIAFGAGNVLGSECLQDNFLMSSQHSDLYQ